MACRNLSLSHLSAFAFGLIFTSLLGAQWAFATNQSGYVYSRAPVLNEETGAQIWGEYNPDDGSYVTDVHDAADEWALTNVTVFNHTQYVEIQAHYESLKEAQSALPFIRTKADYEAYVANENKTDETELLLTAQEYNDAVFLQVDGVTVIAGKPTLGENTNFVAIRPQGGRLTGDPSEIILAEYLFDPKEDLDTSTLSALISDQGEILHQTPNRIGIKSGFLSDKDGNVKDGNDYDRDPGDKIHGPILGAVVEGHDFSRGVTDENGRFSLSWYGIVCPNFYYDMMGWATARLTSQRFNPAMKSIPYPYFISRAYNVSCAYGRPSVWPVLMEFPVDTMVLSGEAWLEDLDGGLINAIDGDDAHTRYKTTGNTIAQIDHNKSDELFTYYDFDGDEKTETIVVGAWDQKEDPETGENIRYFRTEKLDEFIAQTTNGKDRLLQGVFLSSANKTPGEDDPDFTRVLDWQTHFEHEGLVEEITKDDLGNTDLYVFRMSDGKLISERLGLGPNDYWSDETGASTQNSHFYYHSYLRGYAGDLFHRRGHYPNFADWQAKSGINPELHEQKSDHLKPGDVVEIVAINRATGYMGTVQTTMQNTDEGGLVGANLSWPIDPIKLRPPNLKIWVERDYSISQGLKKGEIRQDQIVAYEGAALSSDKAIVVYTEWLKDDNGTLPNVGENMSDYGYTGRVAFLSGDQEIAGDGSFGVAHFAIKPGKQMQVVQLPNGSAGNQHLYVQVNGEPYTGKPVFSGNYEGEDQISKEGSFESTGVHGGALEKRPDLFVPFKVPLYDEKANEELRQAFKKLKADNPTQVLAEPEPVYQWVYRPEFQYSVYGLKVDKLSRFEKDSTTGKDILNVKQPVIANSDDLVELVYSLNLIDDQLGYKPVDFFNTGENKELIFAFGEHEVKGKLVKEGETDKLVFDNIEHLTSLDPEDFLSMRLYTNNDAGNVLWEYAFDFLAIDSRIVGYDLQTDDRWYVTADDPVVPLVAILAGFADRDPSTKTIQTVKWSVGGLGYMDPAITKDTDLLGVFNSTLTMATVAGATGIVRAELQDDANTTAIFKTVEVLPGKPHSIEVTTNGDVSALGIGEMDVKVVVKDQFNNLVADGTSVSFRVAGDAIVETYDTGTISGIARATIKGSEIASVNNTLIVEVDHLSHEENFEVHPLTITIDKFDINQIVADKDDIEVSVTDFKGEPAAFVELSFTSSFGTFEKNRMETDVEGKVTNTLINPNARGEAILFVRAGLAGITKETYSVEYLSSLIRDVETNNALLIGDQISAGHINYERYDNASIGMDYKISESIRLIGESGESVNVTLGDLQDPNLPPIAAFYMNDIESDNEGNESAPDETGLHNAQSKYVSLVEDHPLGKGYSYFFADNFLYDDATSEFIDSHLTISNEPAFNLTNNLGFRLDFKADKNEGVIFDHNGGQQLRINQNGEVEFEITTDSGKYVVKSGVLPLGVWQTVAGRYANNQLELMVNGTLLPPVPASGEVIYTGSEDILVGDNYQGMMNSLRFYDWSALPLITFPGGETSLAVPIDEKGEAYVTVTSTGQMNQFQVNSAIRLLRVAVYGQASREYITLLSSPAYQQIAGQYLNTLYENPPPIDLAGLYNQSNYKPVPGLSFIVPPAHASFDWTLDDVFEGLKVAVDFIVPFESFFIVVEQLGYLAKGDTVNFDAVDLTFASLDLVTIIPVAKPLKLVLKPLKKFVKKFGNKPIVKAVAGVLGEAGEQAISQRKFDKLISLLPYLLIVGEMVAEPGGLEAIELMINSVSSTDDLWAWIEYFNLPDEEWTGEGVPSIELSANYTNEPPLSWLFTPAYAAKKFTARRAAGGVIAKLLIKMNSGFANEYLSKPTSLSSVVREISKNLKSQDATVLRKFSFKADFVKSVLAAFHRAGVNSVRYLLRGRKDDRVRRIHLIASMIYLETEMHENRFSKANGNDIEVRELYANALLGKSEARRHGGSFHLVLAAYMHLLNQTAGGKPVYQLEGTRTIQYLMNSGGNSKNYLKYDREVDIVLGDSTGEVWIEAKSKKVPFKTSEFTPWKVTKSRGKGSIHKQFFADLMGSYQQVVPETVLDFSWRFHSFVAGDNKTEGPTSSSIAQFKLREKLCESPNGGSAQKIAIATAGEKLSKIKDKCHQNSLAYIQLQNNLTMLKDLMKSDIFDEEFKELIDTDLEFDVIGL